MVKEELAEEKEKGKTHAEMLKRTRIMHFRRSSEQCFKIEVTEMVSLSVK